MLRQRPPLQQYSRAHHLEGKPAAVVDLFELLEGRLLSLGNVREVFTKTYVSFLAPSRSFVTVVVLRRKLSLYFSLPWTKSPKPPTVRMRDVSAIGHYGIGHTELSVHSNDDLVAAISVAVEAYRSQVVP